MTANVRKDKRVLGQFNTLLERGIDFHRLRTERLAKVQTAMSARELGALVLTDIMNIRYATGVSVMPLWTAVNLAHYVLVPVEGSPVIFEYDQARHRAEQFWGRCGRPTTGRPASSTSSPRSSRTNGQRRSSTYCGNGAWSAPGWASTCWTTMASRP